ncbi:MAG: ribosome silencing factor [Clostridia bacterium]|nr:ribosome silencing factor [Clostridia bacterium]
MEESKEYRPKVEFDEEGKAVPRSLGEAIWHVLDRRNAARLSLMYLGENSSLSDYFVICSARSSTHVRALADEAEYRLSLAGVKPDNREGKGDGNSWIVIDYGNVMLHVFSEEARQFYNLDRLYPDAEIIEVGPETEEKEDEEE